MLECLWGECEKPGNPYFINSGSGKIFWSSEWTVLHLDHWSVVKDAATVLKPKRTFFIWKRFPKGPRFFRGYGIANTYYPNDPLQQIIFKVLDGPKKNKQKRKKVEKFLFVLVATRDTLNEPFMFESCWGWKTFHGILFQQAHEKRPNWFSFEWFANSAISLTIITFENSLFLSPCHGDRPIWHQATQVSERQ